MLIPSHPEVNKDVNITLPVKRWRKFEMDSQTNSACYPTLAVILNMSIKLDICPTVCGRGERCGEVGEY
jgi:hypothetical protein